MRLLILGGTGPCGIYMIEEALAKGHSCNIYVRSPNKLPKSMSAHKNVEVFAGELQEKEKMLAACKGCDAVLSALGPLVPQATGTLIVDGYSVLVEVMKQSGVKRLLLLGAPCMEDENDVKTLMTKLTTTGTWLLAGNAYKDLVAVRNTIPPKCRDYNITCTVVRVPFLTNKDAKEEVGAGYLGQSEWYLARKDFAKFMLQELDQKKWDNKMPMIWSL